MKKQLDFIVIGAQKSGTTSLHHYLSRHPRIRIPAVKEAPFFTRDDYFVRGMEWYIKEFFPKVSGNQILGTVTPQYMAYPIAVERIRSLCPNARIIAILRDPVARAMSHYKMRVRAFGENRPFEQLISEQLEPESLAESRRFPTPSNSFVVWGEYGRILSEYLSYYNREQLKIVFSDDLEHRPDRVLSELYSFLGIEIIETQPVRTRYNATRNKVEGSFAVPIANAISQNVLIRRIGKWIISENIKRHLRFWSIVNRHDSRIAGEIDCSLSNENMVRLAHHFLKDLELLEVISGAVPWKRRLEQLSSTGAAKSN